MTDQRVAEYTAGFGFKINEASVNKLNTTLRNAERRIKSFAERLEKNSILGGKKLNIGISIDGRKASAEINKELKAVAPKIVLRLDNFVVSQRGIQQAIDRAMIGIKVPAVRFTTQGKPTTGGGVSNPSTFSERLNRGIVRSPFRSMGLAARGALAGGGLLMGYGLGQMNQTLTGLQALPTALEAVTGSPERAKQELAFLNNLGNQVGAPVRELAHDYTGMMASAMGTPLEKQMQSGFTSLTKYGKVMGLSSNEMKMTFKAFNQMISKQQIMA